MIGNLYSLSRFIALDKGLYKDNEYAYFKILRAYKYCILGGYRAHKSQTYVSLRQLRIEKKALMKAVPDIAFDTLEGLGFSVFSRVKLFCFLLLLTPVGLVSRKLSSCLLSLVFYHRLTDDGAAKTFIYFGFLDEVNLCLRLCKKNNHPIGYFELANFFDNTLYITTTKLTVIYDLAKDYLLTSDKITADSIQFQIPAHVILQRAQKNQTSNKIVGFFASGYYARLRHQTHDNDFLTSSERMEAEIISELAAAADSQGWQLLICPHYTRGVEDRAQALNYYGALLHNRPDIDTLVAQTTIDPQEVNLTVTYGSNVFFDAYGLGKKAMLLEGPDVFQPFLQSKYVKPFVIDRKAVQDRAILDILHETDAQFFQARLKV